ncbi:MAG: 2-oxoglutarate ferredoxin oxidoreductase subunit gamma [Clostridiales bacterium]|jgi:2-oxoglutarate ferredoxin oxidoreductase subunit gamma|uniref:2-oxoacid:acceptor oxidoreductase family protein n=1 Tax=Fusibacter paucivorans TaxID=76009 RepID=A0ABS5PLR2_9FIRM|nr:2-oxoacid:acceptor oxidoreductase family protein [Fusibacter paucivorans]MBS7526078.1 2-oxoacid:acceptor oxidoreductase family protein [Fusibacter paucivorans]MDK2867879.1 2-oxoglutarate ferredoxin oxidoreductase subunit gamma [Clostridiales bacterium]MDN5300015.1 2-oxoglutarate ferredoxin oxidoreductase subunit gamma [Clostridiales bacterium]
MLNEKIICAGFGGQGVMSMGMLITYAGMLEGKQVSWLPSYGVEMRGGTANCNVIVAEDAIGAPTVSNDATTAMVMNLPSLKKFENDLLKGGKLFINSSLIDVKSSREDIDVYYIPANEIAVSIGSGKVANLVMLGAYVAATNVVSIDSVKKALRKVFGASKEKMMPLNEAALQRGCDLVG